MSRHRDELYIGHMRDACKKVSRYTADMSWDDFDADDRTQDAVIRQLEIVGEAGGRVGEPFRLAHQEIPWRLVKDVRNQLIHGYAAVELPVVWRIATQDIPGLEHQLETALDVSLEPPSTLPSRPPIRDPEDNMDRGR
ncbi:MAG: HepT-like ribonuclease domain-containing protein [Sulfobacillus sp.]